MIFAVTSLDPDSNIQAVAIVDATSIEYDSNLQSLSLSLASGVRYLKKMSLDNYERISSSIIDNINAYGDRVLPLTSIGSFMKLTPNPASTSISRWRAALDSTYLDWDTLKLSKG